MVMMYTIKNESKKGKDMKNYMSSKNVFESVKDEFEAIAGIVEQSGTWEEENNGY